MTAQTLTGERADLLESLGTARYFLRNTVQGLTDEQAQLRPTVSELTLGGLIKHVGEIELGWARFVVDGPAAVAPPTEQAGWEKWANDFKMLPGESLERILQRYSEIAAETDELVRTVDLDSSHELPPAPWFQPGARRSARRVFTHIVAETAQHAGHADIIRESIDGKKSMG
ncbi:DinB family protein [Dactylosporangium sp. NPDC051541]|uniref:DinB family protein n=1 Tax=Dactylosporangium sp. NPDC051541 TaxID=3363977 RepID=UPI0037AD5694